MRRVLFGCSTVNHLRYVRRLVPVYAARGMAIEIVHMDRANAPDAGGVSEALAKDPALSGLPHTALDAGLTPADLPPKGFRSLSLARRINVLRGLSYPPLDLRDALVITFNDSGAFERHLLWKARDARAATVYVQDGLTNLRPINPLTRLYFNAVKRTPAYLYAPLPQATGPWDVGFFIGDYWTRYAESWHMRVFGRRPICRTMGQFVYWDESREGGGTHESARVPNGPLVIGLLSASYENTRDWTADAEARFYQRFAETLASLHDTRVLIRRHPRQTEPASLLRALRAAGVEPTLAPREQSLHDFTGQADVFYSLGSYAAFEVLRMGKPCFWSLRPFSEMAARIADAWHEPGTETALAEFAEACVELARNPSLGPGIRQRLAERYEPCVSQRSMTGEQLVAEIDRLTGTRT